MYFNSGILFRFGGSGYVLYISNDCNKNTSSYDPGYGGQYELPEGMDSVSEESKCYLAGSENFKVLELEVYALQ